MYVHEKQKQIPPTFNLLLSPLHLPYTALKCALFTIHQNTYCNIDLNFKYFCNKNP